MALDQELKCYAYIKAILETSNSVLHSRRAVIMFTSDYAK